MAVKDATQKISLFSIRNLLLALTFLLVAAIVVLTYNIMENARIERRTAEMSMQLNGASDTLTELKLAVAGERTAVNAAFGFVERPSIFFVNRAKDQRQSATRLYTNLIGVLNAQPDFSGKTKLEKNLKDAWQAYVSIGDQLSKDIANIKQSRILKIREVTSALNGVVDNAAALRRALETEFSSGNIRIEAIKNLKQQLWLMLEYSARDSATISENIASGEPLSQIKIQLVSQYGGIVSGAWEVVRVINETDLTNAAVKEGYDTIETVLFEDFEFLRDDVYSAAEFEDEYPVTVQEWVEMSEEATKPVFVMSDHASNLSKELNEIAVNEANNAVTLSLIGLAVTILVGFAAAWVVIARVVRPVNNLSATMRRLASGKLDTVVPHTEGADEVGDMARSVQVFKENAVERQRLEAERHEQERQVFEQKAEQERLKRDQEEEQLRRESKQREQARQERREDMLKLADQFEASVLKVVENLSASAQEMELSARGMADTASDTTQQAGIVSQVSEQANANVNMVASAAEELSSSVREITNQTTQSSAAARDAVDRTDIASRDVAELVEAAGKIGDVVELINEIAEQTNLLALNATIEAARAGEAGKGFAVVASEVKSLANQTANATKEISEQVNGMQKATGTAVSAMDQIREIIRDIDSTAISIASAVEEQDASTQEIARNVAEVSAGTQEVTSSIHSVSEGATITGTAATQVLSAAQELTQQSSELRKEVDQFVSTIRSQE